eukprot:Hpha_TRINITY_DN13074_c0_g3::TRINITY_DN13074_c0_g3_i1::g.68874::m.68874/K10398/KIF11, EG5; kinesin family member 11
MSTRPRVFVRIRPILTQPEQEYKQVEGATGAQASPSVCLRKESTTVVAYPNSQYRQCRSKFDVVFGPDEGQEDVFLALGRRALDAVVQGYPTTIIAYGQTGGGKTHTIHGSQGDPGLAPRLVTSLFQRLGVEEEFTVSFACLEVYMEEVYDLGSTIRSKLQLQWGRHGAYEPRNLKWKVAKDVGAALGVLASAAERRTVGGTLGYGKSSRSHGQVIVKAAWRNKDGERLTARLNIVDLAGSENVNDSGAKGIQLREAVVINKSLSALCSVVAAVVNNTHRGKRPPEQVPFRESTLTKLLQPHLSGRSVLLVVLCVPESGLWHRHSINSLYLGHNLLRLPMRPERECGTAGEVSELQRVLAARERRIGELTERVRSRTPAVLQVSVIEQESDEAEERLVRLLEERDQARAQLSAVTEQFGQESAQLREELVAVVARREVECIAAEKVVRMEKHVVGRAGGECEMVTALQLRQNKILCELTGREKPPASCLTLLQHQTGVSPEPSPRGDPAPRDPELCRLLRNLPAALPQLQRYCKVTPGSQPAFREARGLHDLARYLHNSDEVRCYHIPAASALGECLGDASAAEEFVRLCPTAVESLRSLLVMCNSAEKTAALEGLRTLCRARAARWAFVNDAVCMKELASVMLHNDQRVFIRGCALTQALVEGDEDVKRCLVELSILPRLCTRILCTDTEAEADEVLRAGCALLGSLLRESSVVQGEAARLDWQSVPGYNVRWSGSMPVLHTLLHVLARQHSGSFSGSPAGHAATALVTLCDAHAPSLTALRAQSTFSSLWQDMLEAVANLIGSVMLHSGASHKREQSEAGFPYQGETTLGKWTSECSGGGPVCGTYARNPQWVVSVPQRATVVAVLRDLDFERRAACGRKRQETQVALLVHEADALLVEQGIRHPIDSPPIAQNATVWCTREVSRRMILDKGDYLLVPAVRFPACGEFSLSIVCDIPPSEGELRLVSLEGQLRSSVFRAVLPAPGVLPPSAWWVVAPQLRLQSTSPGKVWFTESFEDVDDFFWDQGTEDISTQKQSDFIDKFPAHLPEVRLLAKSDSSTHLPFRLAKIVPPLPKNIFPRNALRERHCIGLDVHPGAQFGVWSHQQEALRGSEESGKERALLLRVDSTEELRISPAAQWPFSCLLQSPEGAEEEVLHVVVMSRERTTLSVVASGSSRDPCGQLHLMVCNAAGEVMFHWVGKSRCSGETDIDPDSGPYTVSVWGQDEEGEQALMSSLCATLAAGSEEVTADPPGVPMVCTSFECYDEAYWARRAEEGILESAAVTQGRQLEEIWGLIGEERKAVAKLIGNARPAAAWDGVRAFRTSDEDLTGSEMVPVSSLVDERSRRRELEAEVTVLRRRITVLESAAAQPLAGRLRPGDCDSERGSRRRSLGTPPPDERGDPVLAATLGIGMRRRRSLSGALRPPTPRSTRENENSPSPAAEDSGWSSPNPGPSGAPVGELFQRRIATAPSGPSDAVFRRGSTTPPLHPSYPSPPPGPNSQPHDC